MGIDMLGGFMKKKIGIILGIMFAIIGAISLIKISKIDVENRGALKYTVLEEEDIPQEINEEIQRYKGEGCKNSYICNEKLYILVCYGKQTVPGYEVEVTDIYESSNRIFVKTTLKGSVNVERENELYPYIVIRVDSDDKSVVFI